MCVSVSTCAHRLVHLCVQETRCGSLERHHGLPLRWNSLSVSADARREALRGGDWSTAGQPQLDAKTDAQQHECLVTPSCPVFATPWSVAHRLLCPWDLPGRNTGVGCHFLLQTQQHGLTQQTNRQEPWGPGFLSAPSGDPCAIRPGFRGAGPLKGVGRPN